MGSAGDSLILTAKYNAELVPESGAAGEGRGAKVFGDRVMGVDISAFRFD